MKKYILITFKIGALCPKNGNWEGLSSEDEKVDDCFERWGNESFLCSFVVSVCRFQRKNIMCVDLIKVCPPKIHMQKPQPLM